MYLDKENRFSNAQDITATAASDDLIDLGATSRQLGIGERLYLVVAVTTAFTDSGSDSTVAVTMQTDDATAGVPSGSWVDRQTVGTLGAVSAAGTTLIVPVAAFGTAERFVRLNYTVANGSLTTGAVTAFLTLDVDQWTAHADNITIS